MAQNSNDPMNEVSKDAGFIGSMFLSGGFVYWTFLGILLLANFISYTQGFRAIFPGTQSMTLTGWFFDWIYDLTGFEFDLWGIIGWAITVFFEGMLAWTVSVSLGWGFMDNFVRSHMDTFELSQMKTRLKRAAIFAIPGVVLLILDFMAGLDFTVSLLGDEFSYAPGWFGEWGIRWLLGCVFMNFLLSVGQEVLVFWRRDLAVVASYMTGASFITDVQRAAVEAEKALDKAGIKIDLDTLIKYGFRWNFDGRFSDRSVPATHPFIKRGAKGSKLVADLKKIGFVYVAEGKAEQSILAINAAAA